MSRKNMQIIITDIIHVSLSRHNLRRLKPDHYSTLLKQRDIRVETSQLHCVPIEVTPNFKSLLCSNKIIVNSDFHPFRIDK